MSKIEEIRKRHNATKILTDSENSIGPEGYAIHHDRAELLRVIDAVLDIPIDMHDGVALTVGDTREAIAILRGEETND